MPKTETTYTYADLAGFPADRRYEILGGELYMVPAPSTYHQWVSQDIEQQLIRHVTARSLGVVLHAPVDVIFEDETVLQPDILFVRKANVGVIKHEGLRGAPDLVIEIISAATAHKDRVEKRTIYERFGVSELWYVDPKTKTIEVLDLLDGAYRPRGTFSGQQAVESVTAKGFTLKAAEAFPEPLG